MLQTDHNRWTHNHKKERETSGHKGEEEKFHLLRSVTIQRKIYPNDQTDSRVEQISECLLKGKISNFREVLLDHQLLLGVVGTVYYYQICRRKAEECYRQEEIGFLLGVEEGKGWKISSNTEKMGKSPLSHITTSA